MQRNELPRTQPENARPAGAFRKFFGLEPEGGKRGIIRESWAGFKDEMRMFPGNFGRNVKENWPAFAGALALYGAGSYALQKMGLPKVPVAEHFRISLTAMAVGFWTTFYGDGYGQTALYEGKKDWWRIARRAAIMGLGAGAVLSGILTDNTLKMIGDLTKGFGSAFAKGAALFAGVQFGLMPVFMYPFLKLRDLVEKRIGAAGGEDAKRNFKLSYWKSLFLGVPGNALSCMILPYFSEALRYPVMMFVSFAYFLARTIATEQRWDAEKRGKNG